MMKQSKEPQHIKCIFIPKRDISVAEPIVQIDALGNHTTQMYQLIGVINDEKVGLESLLNHTNKISFSKDDPAMNERHYRINKKYNEEAHNIYNVDKVNPIKQITTTLMTTAFIPQNN